MAATDQHYRAQRSLDVVFGVSCVLMLISVIWMFVQDYDREFKVEQRSFRDVEEAVAQRQTLNLVPDKKQRQAIKSAEEDLAKARSERDTKANELQGEVNRILPLKVKSEARAQSLKADYDSIVSIYNIAVEKRDSAEGTKAYESLKARADQLYAQVQSLWQKLADAQAEVDRNTKQLEDVRSSQKAADLRVADGEDHLKQLTADFERFAKLAVQKRWKPGDTFRKLPVIDAFASPTRIEQFTLTDLPIDYNFKHVTRFDRCTTCHLGIDRPSFDKQALEALTHDPGPEEEKRLETARTMLGERREILHEAKSLGPDDLRVTKLSSAELSEERINEYCAHPRLDLFAQENSPHPAEKMGCTICHAGQGSGTEFRLAAHTPDNPEERVRWTKRQGWEASHFWDFPMLPRRFVEASCLKCHHQVMDMLTEWDTVEIRAGKPVEAPGSKVIRGYNLVREFGCFGCHEIAGNKGGRSVGPDMRLEPSPPLEDMTPAERERMLADPTNPPGTMRKVGPSLRRLSEKTNAKWVRRWISSPRGFRPDTRMPHFYGLSNNRPDDLPEDQKAFPDAEIHAIAYYLFRESNDLLAGKDTYFRLNQERKEELEDKKKRNLISEAERKELEEVTRRLELARTPEQIRKQLIGYEGNLVQLPAAATTPAGQEEQLKRGRQLFTEKGCLACHTHSGTYERMGEFPAVKSEANFGPNLSQLALKIAPENGDPEGKRRWLVQWIMNPNIHFPRTRMPITHLSPTEAADIAAWLLSRPAAAWDVPDPAVPKTDVLERMARLYLEKSFARQEVTDMLQAKGLSKAQEEALKASRRDADERRLAVSRRDESWEDKLKWYVGKKAIGSLGCYGCHEVPGFESAKPVGTPLNDWGKKDPERLAFEDIEAYVNDHYYFTPGKVDEHGHGFADKDKRPPYEEFFHEALDHHQRDGFLNQKLVEPRSYDYNRLRTWDDRLRMPQFRFARKAVPLAGESEEQAQYREEAEAREAMMTFILGLVAEPVPLKFVHDPQGDKLAEAKGKQVLEKFNCAGCHQLRPGIYEFNIQKPSTVIADSLESAYKLATAPSNNTYLADLPFPNHNGWFGRPSPRPDRVIARGLPDRKDEGTLQVRLTEALRFMKKKEDVANPEDSEELKPGTYDIPASDFVGFPVKELTSRTEPHGGTFVDLIVPYLVERKPNIFLDDNPKAHSGLPPPLLREGERVQPGWLFGFLKNPFQIRKVTILRMPRFNMSDEEAMSLVNYFAAVDRRENPGISLTYPYEAVPQRNEDYLAKQGQQYFEKLGPETMAKRAQEQHLESLVWDRLLRERIGELSDQVKAAEQAAQAAKGADQKPAQERLQALKAELKKLTDEAGQKDGPYRKQLREKWERETAYTSDAYRLLANNELCLKCHQVGIYEASQPIGPNLDLIADRLRPGWTQRWISSPQRLLVYPEGQHPMPQPFLANKPEQYQDTFVGPPREQATALRDILMNYLKVANLSENRWYRPTVEAPK
jgi:mono/diheme cytochrome c family protein